MIAKSDNFCNKYSTLFGLPATGNYRLKVFRLRKDYSAIKMIPTFPVMDLDVFIDELLPMVIPEYMPVPCGYDSVNGYWVTHSNQISEVPFMLDRDCGKTLAKTL